MLRHFSKFIFIMFLQQISLTLWYTLPLSKLLILYAFRLHLTTEFCIMSLGCNSIHIKEAVHAHLYTLCKHKRYV